MTDTLTSAKKMFAYDYWANAAIVSSIDELIDAEIDQKQTLKLYAHLLVAQDVWRKRMLGEDYSDIKIWPSLSVDECYALCDRVRDSWTAFFSDPANADLDRDIHYSNSKGDQFSTRASDILQHLIIHGQHHRAQIAVVLRLNGIEPPRTDYIYYLRSLG